MTAFLRNRFPWRRWLAGALLAGAAAAAPAQTMGTSFPTDLCPGDRFGTSLGCSAKDVQITSISIAPGSPAPATCEGGTSLTLDLNVTVQFGKPDRFDIGIFLSQDGGNPQLLSTRTTAGGTGSASCKVAVLPVGPFVHLDRGPFTIGGQSVFDACGDGNAKVIGTTGAATFTIPAVTVKCQALNGTGALNIPFVVSWDHQDSPTGNVCTGPEHPVPGTTSKCNAPDGTQGDVAVVAMPRITKTNPVTSITPGDTTTYTITVANTTGIALGNVVYKDPAVPNLTVTSLACAAQGTSCPTPANTTIALMQGAGIVIPSMPVGSTVTFTVGATLTGNPTGTLTNTASVTVNGGTRSASDADAIVYPSLVNTKTVTVLSDPINGATNPKNIPGAEALYTISVANTGLGRVDSNSLQLADRVPPNTALFVGNLGGTPAGPVTWSESGSNLTFSYGGLGAAGDDVEFSNNGGASWGYVPVADANGYDAAVTHLRLSPKGRMAGWSGAGPYPGFGFSFKVRLN